MVITDELPRTPHGKLDRPAALELGRPVATETSVVDRDDPVAATVVGIWRRVLDDDSVGARSDFFDHGGDSLKAVEVAIELQEHLGIHVDIGAILEHRTPGALATQLHEGTVIASTLVRFRSGDPAAPVTVLFPPGGGELFRYWPLVEQLDAGGDVYGLRFDALGPDGGVIDSGRLTDALLREEFGNRELVLVGWSTGGLYAYEVLQRRLAAATSDPTTVVPRLAMIDTVFPSMIDHIHEPRVAKYRRLISELGPRGVFDALAQAARQRSGRLLTRVEARRDRARGVTESAEAQLLQRMKAVRETAMAYRPTRTEAPVLYIRASNSNRAVTMEPWVDYLPAVDEVVADGDHDGENSVLEPHNVASLAAHLTGLLTDTSRG